jgi:hypothetical protein
MTGDVVLEWGQSFCLRKEKLKVEHEILDEQISCQLYATSIEEIRPSRCEMPMIHLAEQVLRLSMRFLTNAQNCPCMLCRQINAPLQRRL